MKGFAARIKFPYLVALTTLWWLGDSVLEFTLPVDFQNRGLSLSAIGVLLAVPALLGLAIDLPVGFLSNAAHLRKMLMGWGLGLSAIGAALIWGWSSIFFLTLGLAVWGAGYQLWKVPRDASLSAETALSNRGFRFGVDWNVNSFAAFLGPILAGLILERYHAGGGYAFYLLTTLLVLVGLSAGWPKIDALKPASEPPNRQLWWPLVKSSARVLMIFLAVAAWTQILWSYGPIFITRPEIGLEPWAGGLVLGSFSLPPILLSAWAGRLADRFNRSKTVALGLGLAGLGLIWFALAPTLFSLIASALAAAIGLALALPAATADLFDRVTAGRRGAIAGLWNFSMDIGYVIGPLIGAALVWRLPLQSIFITAGGLFLGLAIFETFGPPRQSAKPL